MRTALLSIHGGSTHGARQAEAREEENRRPSWFTGKGRAREEVLGGEEEEEGEIVFCVSRKVVQDRLGCSIGARRRGGDSEFLGLVKLSKAN